MGWHRMFLVIFKKQLVFQKYTKKHMDSNHTIAGWWHWAETLAGSVKHLFQICCRYSK